MKLNLSVEEIKLFLWEHSDSCMFGQLRLVVYKESNYNSTDE